MDVLEIYRKMKKLPFGDQIFTKAICYNAPYFSSIHPSLVHFSEGDVEFKIKNRRSVQNHLGTVHAIAMCNLAEICGGMCMETIIDPKRRWIPKGMKVRYLAKAGSDLVGSTQFLKSDLLNGSNILKVDVKDTSGIIVFDAEIEMYVSDKS